MPQITIIGLGTVGSSLGLALRRYAQAPEGKAAQFTVVGYDPDLSMQQIAQRKDGAVDRTVGDLAAAVRDAPFVIIALPTTAMRAIFDAIAPHLPEGATVTDTAPGKRQVLRWAAELLPAGVSFVGGHPLPRKVPAPAVTSDEVTDEPPDADLFTGAPYCIMPGATATDAAVNQVIGFAEAIGAKPFFTDPLEHDSFQAAVHDLPLVTSFALMRVLSASPSWRDMSPLAGGAFREASRMASVDALATREELLANRDNVLGWIDRYQVVLSELREMLAEAHPTERETGTARELGAALIAARNARTGWINPNAALTPAEREARDTMKGLQAGSGIMRGMFGNILGDRLMGHRDRDGERKDRP
ncbi:MAG TPA: prephenate dehydrogenase [Chloroflexia bacterium]|nr:prephenate dehydrogenase [Chloroflexia bacterium]